MLKIGWSICQTISYPNPLVKQPGGRKRCILLESGWIYPWLLCLTHIEGREPLLPPKQSKIFWTLGIGCLPVIVLLSNLWYSIPKCKVPSFLWTYTIGLAYAKFENHLCLLLSLGFLENTSHCSSSNLLTRV